MLDDSVEYWLDKNDVIVKVNEGWHEFYRQNTNDGSGDQFLGKSIFNWIIGTEVQEIHRYLLSKVRDQREIVMLPFRCDSPDTLRQLVMCIDSRDGEEVHFQTWVLKVRPLNTPPGWNSSEPITVCSWCKRILSKHAILGTRWLDLESAVREMGLLERPMVPKFTHGICPDCKNLVRNGISPLPPHLLF